MQKIKYIEIVFHDLEVTRSDDHSKGRMLYGRIPKFMQTSVVLFIRHLLTLVQVEKLNNSIYVHWLDCTRLSLQDLEHMARWISLILNQSMPDHFFNFLLNYIDHGIKPLFSVPLLQTWGTCISFALFQIFTEMDLQ